MIIPHEELQPETLRALVEEFVTRHGAIHGHHDSQVAHDIESVMRELRTGRAVIVFDEEDESFTIVPKEDLR